MGLWGSGQTVSWIFFQYHLVCSLHFVFLIGSLNLLNWHKINTNKAVILSKKLGKIIVRTEGHV